ncbi:hypothetical protein PKB_1317 [Pseudomonas knackmussii B13]|uniref:Uncharacterized protein n=1 Tax=Pseudomonas knackmussii (strain DSM 6978 / CCUG 54928 / LMG 23759 / B13) TaxID=1301098 RepID=A0A024HDW1_PSEKB|nr:hypothetical protein [Pseudomonas knackmussii]CDF82682.1 hypothetical protein PKB_1317 [Pseudomonas knackmussii B13]
MDSDQIEDMFGPIDEQAMPMGLLQYDEAGNAVIPFVCLSHRFFALFDPVETSEYRTWVHDTVRGDADYSVSPNAYLMKFVSIESYLGDCDNYAPPASLSMRQRVSIRQAMPDRLYVATRYFLEATPHADELYFHPAAPEGEDSVKRYLKLNTWYSQISHGIAVEKLGMSPIHPEHKECYWYGYRKAHPERNSAG